MQYTMEFAELILMNHIALS